MMMTPGGNIAERRDGIDYPAISIALNYRYCILIISKFNVNMGKDLREMALG